MEESTEGFKIILEDLKSKFLNKQLNEADFDVAIGDVSKSLERQDSKRSSIDKSDAEFSFDDDFIESDYELDIENGQITVLSPVKKGGGICYECQIAGGRRTPKKKEYLKEEQILRNRMKMLMSTFESETRKFDNKVKIASDSLQKKFEAEYDAKLQAEKETWEGMINELLSKLEHIKQDRENLIVTYENEKKEIENFYLARIKEDRKKMKLELQKNLIKAAANSTNNNDWQKTAI